METSVAGVTVKALVTDTLPRAAVIVTDPGLAAVASPLDPDALLTEATAMLEELQVTEAVRLCVELSV